MPREYRHIQQYKKEIIELWEQGKALQEIADMFGFTREQLQGFKTRYNRKQRKLAAGITIKPKGKLTQEYNIIPSMSRRGNPYDNALAENFFSILKTECIYRVKLQTY